MKIVYTTQTSDFREGFAYRNPRYFSGVERGAERVLVIGDWPAVVAAYEKAGVEVDHTAVPLREAGPTVAEYVAAGYLAENYPPTGFGSRSTDAEIADAIAAQNGAQLITSTIEQRPDGAAPGEQMAGLDPDIPPAAIETPELDDGLGPLDAEQLHALAKERGVKVHHAAGADKVREALREAQGE